MKALTLYFFPEECIEEMSIWVTEAFGSLIASRRCVAVTYPCVLCWLELDVRKRMMLRIQYPIVLLLSLLLVDHDLTRH